jgi:hypothetical protein
VRRFAPQLFAQVFCITLLLLAVSNSQAQFPRRLSGQEQIQNREWALANLRREASVDHRAWEKALLQLELKNDYRKLQVVNNDLMKRVFKPSGTEPITEKEIRSSLGEIKKLAERLRANFGLPKIETEEAAIDLALKPGLLQLDKAVMSFVDNPLLQQPRVYDAELASQAGRDLTDVSRLAGALRKLTKEK